MQPQEAVHNWRENDGKPLFALQLQDRHQSFRWAVGVVIRHTKAVTNLVPTADRHAATAGGHDFQSFASVALRCN